MWTPSSTGDGLGSDWGFRARFGLESMLAVSSVVESFVANDVVKIWVCYRMRYQVGSIFAGDGLV